MPPLPPVSQVLRVVLKYTLAEDQDVINRFYIGYTALSGTTPGLATFCASVGTAWNTNLAPEFGVSKTLTEVSAEDLTSSTAPFNSVAVSHVGTRPGAELSAGTCAVVRFEIPRRYRGGHPRVYLAALVETDLNDLQTWKTASLTSLTSAWASFIASVNAAAITWAGGGTAAHVNVSYYEGFHNVTYPSGRVRSVPTLRPTPEVDDVASYVPNPNVCSQRRRNLAP